MEVKARHFLSSKNIKRLTEEIIRRYPHLSGKIELKNLRVEMVETTSKITVYSVNDRVDWIMREDLLLPSIGLLNRGLDFPFIVVDMGAVPFVAKGADVMLPGIVRHSDNIAKGVILKIVDELHGKAIAVGESLIDEPGFRAGGKGRSVKILHHVGDRIWALISNLGFNIN